MVAFHLSMTKATAAKAGPYAHNGMSHQTFLCTVPALYCACRTWRCTMAGCLSACPLAVALLSTLPPVTMTGLMWMLCCCT